MNKGKTIYDLPQMAVTAYRVHILKLINKAIRYSTDENVKRGLVQAEMLVRTNK